MADDCFGPLCAIGEIGESIRETVETIGGAVSFAKDPFGATLEALKDGAKSLTSDVLPVLTTALQPDLTADFFINAYRISFAAAIFVMVLVLISLFVRTAKGTIAGRDLVQSVVQYAPMFLIGSMFGPLFGIFLVELFHRLTDSIIQWGTGGQAEKIIEGLLALFDKIDPAAFPGGVLAAILLMLLMMIGLLFVVVILLCQLVTLYFTGILIPLFLVFVIDPERRGMGLGLIGLWVGVLAAHPLMFFLLGFAFSIMGDTIASVGEKDGLQVLVTLCVALIAIYMAAFSPMALMKFAPALQGALTPTPKTAGGGGDIGHHSISAATNEYGNGGREGTTTSGPATSTTSSTSSSSSTSSTSTTDTSLSESSVDTSSQTAGKAAVGTEAPSVGASASTGAGATAGTAEGGAAGLAEAGAAESTTGVGAAVGVPTLIAAAGVAAAGAAKTGADAVVAQTVAPMEDNTLGGSTA